MIYLLYISWLFITQADDCFEGSFEMNDLDKCVLNCNDDDVKFVDKAEVTFTQLLHSCYNVRRGYQLGDCTEVADLVWSVDNCGCPYCACASKDVAGSPVVFERVMGKICYNCTCNAHKYDTTVEGNVLDCDYTGSAGDAYEWKDFECPQKYCTDDNDNEVDINDYWWADVAADAKCEKFCYCDAGAATVCVTGWSNILESENEGVLDAFNRGCKSDITDCLDEPDRLFTTNVGPSCYSCPKCNCGSRAVGDKWWVEYEDEDEPGSTQCVQCECMDTGDVDNIIGYAECGMNSIGYVKGTGECPPKTTYKCHSEYGGSTDPTGTVVTVGTLNSETCYDIELPSSWCSWSVSNDVSKIDGALDDNDWSIRWEGCDYSIWCAIFGGNDECFYSEWSNSYTDCYGRARLSTDKRYVYCCNSDDCNHKDIDIATCKEKKAYGEVMASANQCSYDYQTKDNAHCSVDNYKEEKTTCANVRGAYMEYMGCQCEMMSGMYKEASSDIKKIFDKQQKGFFSDSGLYEWNEALGCNTNLLCNLKTGSVYDKADNKIYFVATIFTAIVVMIIY